MNTPPITLLHGVDIPRVGLGTWPFVGEECQLIVRTALDLGYRLIDTSHKYDNENAVGKAIRRSGIPRDQLFVTSKFNKENHSVAGVKTAYEESLRRTGLDYLDLFLIHWPVPALNRYVDAWEGLVALLEAGSVRAIGVSNFKPAHLDRIIAATDYVPDVNQIQLSADIARTLLRTAHDNLGITTEAWSPLGRGATLRDNEQVTAIAHQVGRSPAQVLLRWHVQMGIVPIPRSSNSQQLAQNLDLFDFELSPAQMTVLGSLDRGESAARDADDPSNGH